QVAVVSAGLCAVAMAFGVDWRTALVGALGLSAYVAATELEQAMLRARAAARTYLICIDTDDTRTTQEGGCWWEVAVPEVSTQPGVQLARARYELDRQGQQQ
ncbi:MAG: 3D-(3,5/4)-trihydroxycyclohexane-1,2-dione acylhydrolase (decyclizing), partial [Janthinobacterium sp.]